MRRVVFVTSVLLFAGCAAWGSGPRSGSGPSPAAAVGAGAFEEAVEGGSPRPHAHGVVADLTSDAAAGAPGGVPSPARSPAPDKLVVEAWLHYRVGDVEEAAARVRALARTVGARIVSDDVKLEPPSGVLVLRVPPAGVEPVYSGLSQIGLLTQRNVRATEVSKELVDNQIALDNMKKALARYQEILKTATTVSDILAVEAQLARVKSDIERLQGRIAYVSDRVALATVTVSLEGTSAAPSFLPEAKFNPGVGYGYLGLYRDSARPRHHLGPKASLHVARFARFEVGVFDDLDSKGWHGDAVRLAFGADAYSDFLGGGRRRFLNPTMGMVLGAAWLGEDQARLEVGVALGLELVRTEMVLVDLRAVGTAWLGRGKPYLAVQPSLGVNLAF